MTAEDRTGVSEWYKGDSVGVTDAEYDGNIVLYPAVR